MKIQIECDDTIEETLVKIQCRELDDTVKRLQQALAEAAKEKQLFVFYKGDTEFYLSLSDILFFETDGGIIQVHTKDDIYQTNYKLYELEELLPGALYAGVQIRYFEHRAGILHNAEPFRLQCCAVSEQSQTGICFQNVLQTVEM